MSSTPWENVYVFISSTFNDMHAERDYLVKRVFPELSEWCAARRLRLMDIDLRWGVTEKDSQENKRVVDVCLSGIDRCRPLFLCFLGQRRGWVPDEKDISETTFSDFPKLKQYLGSSVTEMEIIHALIDPMLNGSVLELQNRERAFFFQRDGAYLADITDPAVRNIYSNEGEPDPADADEKLRTFRETIRNTGRPLHTYSVRWDKEARTPELLAPGKDASIAAGRLTGFSSEGRALSEVILEELKAAVEELYPGRKTSGTVTRLQKELDEQAVFRQTALEGFIEREGDFDPVEAYLTDGDRRPMALCAQAGMGKTSYLARLTEKLSREGKAEILSRFIGTSENSVSLSDLLVLIAQELEERFSLRNVPNTAQKVRDNFYGLLASAVKEKPLVLIIDALNQLDSGLSDLSWIPEVLPENVKLIVSFKLGDPDGDALCGTILKNNSMRLHTLKGFQDRSSRAAIVKRYLSQYLKELDDREIETIISLEGSANPLYLKVLLSELKVFGSFEGLHDLITTQFGSTAAEAFDGLLKRLETDPGHSPVPAKDLAVNVFGWLSHSKNGLQADELADLLVDGHYAGTPEDARDSVNLLLRQIRPFLAKRDKRQDFFYESFLLAAKKRYSLPENGGKPDAEWHKELAQYFRKRNFTDIRKLSEQAYQAAHAGMSAYLRNLLVTFNYLERRAFHTGMSALLEDYSLITLPAAQIPPEEQTQLFLIRDALEQSASVITRNISQLAVQLYGRLDGFGLPLIRTLLSDTQRYKEKYKVPWLRPLCAFLPQPGSRIVRYIKTLWKDGACMFSDRKRLIVYIPDEKAVQIIEIATGRVLRSYPLSWSPAWMCLAEEENVLAVRSRGGLTFLDLTTGNTYPAEGVRGMNGNSFDTANGMLVQTGTDLQTRVKTTYVSDVRTGKLLYSSSHDWSRREKYISTLLFDPVTGYLLFPVENRGVSVIDPARGFQEVGMYLNHPENIHPSKTFSGKIFVPENTPFIITLTEFDGLTVYHRDTREVLMNESAYAAFQNRIAVSADGKLLAQASFGSIYLYSLETFRRIRTLKVEQSENSIEAVTISGDKQILYICRARGQIELYDAETGEMLRSFSESRTFARELFLNDSEDKIVSFNKDEVLIWDLKRETVVSDPGLSKMQVQSAALAPNDRFLIVTTPSSDGGVFRIEIPSMECRELVTPGHSFNGVSNVVISPDSAFFAARKNLDRLVFVDCETGEQLAEMHAVDADDTGDKDAMCFWDYTFLPKELCLGERGLTVLYRQNGNVIIQDPDVPEKTKILRLFPGSVNSIKLFENGHRLAAWSGTTVFDPSAGELKSREDPSLEDGAKIIDLDTLECLLHTDDRTKVSLEAYALKDRPNFRKYVENEYKKPAYSRRIPELLFRTEDQIFYYQRQPSANDRFAIYRTGSTNVAYFYLNEGPQNISHYLQTADGRCCFLQFGDLLCPFCLENLPGRN